MLRNDSYLCGELTCPELQKSKGSGEINDRRDEQWHGRTSRNGHQSPGRAWCDSMTSRQQGVPIDRRERREHDYRT